MNPHEIMSHVQTISRDALRLAEGDCCTVASILVVAAELVASTNPADRVAIAAIMAQTAARLDPDIEIKPVGH